MQYSHSRPAWIEEHGRAKEAQRGGGQMPPKGDPGEPCWEQQGGDPGHESPDQQE